MSEDTKKKPAAPKPAVKSKKKMMVGVTILSRKNQSVLIEWHDGDGSLCRSYMPASSIHNVRPSGKAGEVDSNDLALGIAYGIPWSKFIRLSATPEQVEQALYRAGIWTREELKRGPATAVSALRDVYSVDLASLFKAAAEFHKNDGGSK